MPHPRDFSGVPCDRSFVAGVVERGWETTEACDFLHTIPGNHDTENLLLRAASSSAIWRFIPRLMG